MLEATIRTQDWEGAHILGKLGAELSPVVKGNYPKVQAHDFALGWSLMPFIATLGQAALETAMQAQEWKAARALAVLGWDTHDVIEFEGVPVARSSSALDVQQKLTCLNAGLTDIDAALEVGDWKRVRFLAWLKIDGNITAGGVSILGTEQLRKKRTPYRWDPVFSFSDRRHREAVGPTP